MSLQNTIFGLQVGMSSIIADDEKVPQVITDLDVQHIQSCIRSQISAIQAHNCISALQFATPEVRSLFKDPNDLLGIVLQLYPMVYYSNHIDFGELELTPAGLGQLVTFFDRDGDQHHAIYILECHASGEWKIAGCMSLGQNPDHRPQLPMS